MKTAIITGFSGQDGCYLSKLLLDKGYRVIGTTRDRSKVDTEHLEYLGIAGRVEIVELAQTDSKYLVTLLEQTAPDEIYNLAAQSSVGISFREPEATIQYNVLSVLSWLEAIRIVDTKIRFYQASSSEMFGNVGNLPLRESLVFHPASPYGISKAAAHWAAVNYRETNQMHCACGILFNHESVLRGGHYVVKKIVSQAVQISEGTRQEPVCVGNTTIRRDWGYAPEFVEAMWRILQHDEPQDFMVCSGNVMSLDGLIEIVFSELGLDRQRYLQTDASLFRPNELMEIYGDNRKAKEVLGWEYELSNEELIRRLIADERHYQNWARQRKEATC